MSIVTLRVIVTLVSFLAFAGVVAWAVAPMNRGRFDEASRLPLDDESPSPQPSPKGEGALP